MPREYDLCEPAIFTDPYPFYQRVRASYPVHLDSHLGCWVVTSYAEVVSGLANRDLSSERVMRGAALQEEGWHKFGPLFEHISNLMFYTDPPKHTHIRSLVNKALSARMVEKWREHIQDVVNEQLAPALAKGRIDIIRDLAFPLPFHVIANMLGIPPHEHHQLKRWSDDLADFLGNPPTIDMCTRLMRSIQEFTDYLRVIVAEHRTHPEGDLIDALLQAEDHGVVLSEDELLMNCIGLFGGGHETTTNAIGNGIFALMRNPREMQRLRDDPTLIVSAVEELLRYDSPVQFTARIAKQTTEIGGKKIYKGQSVMLMLGAANRDPHQFQNPDTLNICRQDNRHLAFGNNIHYCVGSALARLEIQIAIMTILQSTPVLQLADAPLEWQENLSFHGLKALHVIF
jgi:pimeloyl-[acyl-carrier protein] synthase